MTAADHLLSGPFGAVKRFALREGEDSKQHVKDMSFAQELVMMPPFPRESAVMQMRCSPALSRATASLLLSNPQQASCRHGGRRTE